MMMTRCQVEPVRDDDCIWQTSTNVGRPTSASSIRSASTVLADTHVHVLVAIGPQGLVCHASVSNTTQSLLNS